MTETAAAAAPFAPSAGHRMGPVLCRQQVAGALRQARQARGLTRQQAAGAVEFSLSKLIRIEAGTTRVSVTGLRALLDLYQVTGPAQAARLEEMSRAARHRPWFSAHHGVTPDLAAAAAELCIPFCEAGDDLCVRALAKYSMTTCAGPESLARDESSARSLGGCE